MLPSVPVHPHRLQVWRGHPGGLLRPWGARLGAPYGARRVPGFWGGAVGRRGCPSECWRWQPLAWLPAPFGGPRAAAQPPRLPGSCWQAFLDTGQPVLSASQMSPGAGVPSRPPPPLAAVASSPHEAPPGAGMGRGARSPHVPWGVSMGTPGTHMGTQRREPPQGDNNWGLPERAAPPCPETPGARC